MIALPPDLFTHIANVAGDKIVGFFVDKTLGKVADVVGGVFKKREDAAEESGDAERLEREVERLSEIVASLESTIRHEAPFWDWTIARDEVSEPAFVRFVEDAMAAAAASPTPSKRLLLGRLVATRLQMRTESAEELALRRALRVASDLTESQLLLLAAALLVQRLPSEGVPKFESRDDAEAWLRAYCSPTLDRLIARVPWGSEDFETLASDGAILLDRDPVIEGNFGSHNDVVEQWLYVHGVPPYDGLEGEWGTNESHTLFAARFPAIVALKRLGRNGHSDKDLAARRVNDAALTPLGSQLGLIVFEQMRGNVPETIKSLGPIDEEKGEATRSE